MHGRRSIIKRRDDDDITMTRPLNKRVSFSVNNHTRLFQVDSDESTRQTNLDSTRSQSMEHTLAHSMTFEFCKSPSTAPMETTGLEDQPNDAEDAGFDWTDENMEVDLNASSSEPSCNNEPMNADKAKFSGTSTRISLEVDDKTRPVELRNEQTDSVKDEILRVASRLLKPGYSSDETTSTSIDLYGIKATLDSQRARQQKPERKPEPDAPVQPAQHERPEQHEQHEQPERPERPEQPVCFQMVSEVTSEVIECHSKQVSFSCSKLQISSDCYTESVDVYLKNTDTEQASEDTEIDADTNDDTISQHSQKSCSINESETEELAASLDEESQYSSSQTFNRPPSESWFNVTGVKNFDQDESSLKDSQQSDTLDDFTSTHELEISCDQQTEQNENKSPEMEFEAFESTNVATNVTTNVAANVTANVAANVTTNVAANVVTNVDSSSSTGKFSSFNEAPEDELSESVDTSTPKSPAASAISRVSKTRKTDEISASNETYSVYNTTQATVDVDVSNVADEPELSFMKNSFTSTSLSESPHLTRTKSISKRISETSFWSLDDWIKYDQDLFSVFGEAIPEVQPVPEPVAVEHNLHLDQERLQKALQLDPDPEFEEFIKREKAVSKEVNDQCVRLIKSLELALRDQSTILIDDVPFYNHLPAEKFKIVPDVRSKSVTVCYRISLIPCLMIECKEKKDGTVEILAKVIDSVPQVVCPFLSYVQLWMKNAFGGTSNLSTQTWLKAQSKVLSALEVIDAHFEAFKSVIYRLHWCEQKQQVYLNLGWRSRVVRVYIDADLREELVPQEVDTIKLRNEDLQFAWKSDRFSTFRDRINSVHRRNLEIATEELLQSAKF